MDTVETKLGHLRNTLSSMDNLAVAFSGGIDSSLILRVASDLPEIRVMALMAVSELVSQHESSEAERIAESLEVPFRKVSVQVMENDAFVENSKERCYLCKRMIFERLLEAAREENLDILVDGTNLDDLGEDRPGLRALEELGVRSPLAEIRISKTDVREMARRLNMENVERPENTCLATRIPRGQMITLEKLQRIDDAESFLRSLGVQQLRVRDHEDLARIEVLPDQFEIILNNANAIAIRFRELGFRFITLDLEGFRSGSLG
ncbi:MAG: ATP-dependent sacrificial sulfur transferase LarE [Methanomassiliicoccales archaeon]|nr:ATP-dependent sacrificial sulfur transferase LarE [Methanomassiliicoccales archaeon]